MTSVRFGDLERAAKEAARKEGVTYSEFVRAAVRDRTEQVLARADNATTLADIIGCVDDPAISSLATSAQARAILNARSRHRDGAQR